MDHDQFKQQRILSVCNLMVLTQAASRALLNLPSWLELVNNRVIQPAGEADGNNIRRRAPSQLAAVGKDQHGDSSSESMEK